MQISKNQSVAKDSSDNSVCKNQISLHVNMTP